MKSSVSREERIARIYSTLLSEKVDLHRLHELSRQEGGFISNEVRQRVWPKLLGVNRYSLVDFKSNVDPKRNFKSIQCDVDRSLWKHDIMRDWDETERNQRRASLFLMIQSILSRHPSLHYYQGFHDILSVFLLVIGNDTDSENDSLACSLAEATSLLFLQDYMGEDFETLSQGMKLTSLLLQIVDPTVHTHLLDSEVQPYFCTSWLLTWLSHDIDHLETIARLFDALLCSHPLYIIYLTVALVLRHRLEILERNADFAEMHILLSNLTRRLLPQPVHVGGVGKQSAYPIESLLRDADRWMAAVPPEMLRSAVDKSPLRPLLQDDIFHILTKSRLPRYADSDWILLLRSRKAHFRQLYGHLKYSSLAGIANTLEPNSSSKTSNSRSDSPPQTPTQNSLIFTPEPLPVASVFNSSNSIVQCEAHYASPATNSTSSPVAESIKISNLSKRSTTAVKLTTATTANSVENVKTERPSMASLYECGQEPANSKSTQSALQQVRISAVQLLNAASGYKESDHMVRAWRNLEPEPRTRAGRAITAKKRSIQTWAYITSAIIVCIVSAAVAYSCSLSATS